MMTKDKEKIKKLEKMLKSLFPDCIIEIQRIQGNRLDLRIDIIEK